MTKLWAMKLTPPFSGTGVPAVVTVISAVASIVFRGAGLHVMNAVAISRSDINAAIHKRYLFFIVLCLQLRDPSTSRHPSADKSPGEGRKRFRRPRGVSRRSHHPSGQGSPRPPVSGRNRSPRRSDRRYLAQPETM